MTRTEVLTSLEGLLESFIEQAIEIKEDRLRVLDGINRLDDIALGFKQGDNLVDQIGGWFAEHNNWLSESALKPAEHNRIGNILTSIRKEIKLSETSSPETTKIELEINRWQTDTKTEKTRPKPETKPKLILTRKQDNLPGTGSIRSFIKSFDKITALFKDSLRNRTHIMSVLDDTLLSALNKLDKEALLLSALIIYYLRHHGYKVEPYVKRLKEAEQAQKGGLA